MYYVLIQAEDFVSTVVIILKKKMLSGKKCFAFCSHSVFMVHLLICGLGWFTQTVLVEELVPHNALVILVSLLIFKYMPDISQ